MQVELSVQNCFYESSPSQDSNLELNSGDSDSLISAQTWETWFHQWLEILHPKIPPAQIYELSLRLTDDTEIQALNAQYRNQNRPTDVLAFAALEVDCPQPAQWLKSIPLHLGDIVISVDTAQRQAGQQGHNVKIELAWLAAHGLLHLLGWDHPDEDSLTEMLDQQALLLKQIGITTLDRLSVEAG